MKASKTLLTLASLFLFLFFFFNCNQPAKESETAEGDSSEYKDLNEPDESNESESAYDAALAKKLGADDYGMKTYVFALLKAGPTRDQDSVTRAQIQRAHLDNITRMADEGKLVAAGPFMEEGDFQGIYVFNVETVEEARELTKTDPAVQAGRLAFEFYTWYSSATLQLINEWHYKVAKQGI